MKESISEMYIFYELLAYEQGARKDQSPIERFKELKVGDVFFFPGKRPLPGWFTKVPDGSGPFVKISPTTFRTAYLDLFHCGGVYEAFGFEHVKRRNPSKRSYRRPAF